MDREDNIYRWLVSEVSDYAICMIDPGGIVQTWNAGAARLKGYDAAEIVGSHFSLFYLPEDIEARLPETHLETALANGRYEDEGWRVRKDRTIFWANVLLTAVYDEGGHHRGFAEITRDLTRRRQKDLELKETRAELERRLHERTLQLADTKRDLAEANRAKDEFLATLSHELRTPLTSAFGWVQLLMNGAVGEIQRRKGLAVIDRNLRAQIRLIEDLLHVSHIAAGKIHLDLREVDIVQLVRGALDSFRPSARTKGIDLKLPSAGASILAVIDPARFQQIVSNLLANAIKFTPSGGRVEVSLERGAESFIMRVADTGEGISPEFFPHVFERFRQADSSHQRKHGGLGIGLALVLDLVELHRGTVSVASAGRGAGATFTVTLPLRAARDNSLRPPMPRPA